MGKMMDRCPAPGDYAPGAPAQDRQGQGNLPPQDICSVFPGPIARGDDRREREKTKSSRSPRRVL